MIGTEYGIFSAAGDLIERGFETEREAFEAMNSEFDEMDDFISKICKKHLQPYYDCELCE